MPSSTLLIFVVHPRKCNNYCLSASLKIAFFLFLFLPTFATCLLRSRDCCKVNGSIQLGGFPQIDKFYQNKLNDKLTYHLSVQVTGSKCSYMIERYWSKVNLMWTLYKWIWFGAVSPVKQSSPVLSSRSQMNAAILQCIVVFCRNFLFIQTILFNSRETLNTGRTGGIFWNRAGNQHCKVFWDYIFFFKFSAA